MARAAFTVKLELGEPCPGVWCDTCLLPSAITWPLYGVFYDGVIDLGTITACPAHVDAAAFTREAARRVTVELRNGS